MTGVIIDEETSEPLPFATIGLKNKGKGTVTNFNGVWIKHLNRLLFRYTFCLLPGLYKTGDSCSKCNR
ncbi:MAG: carboxypeptidase-like regulatory domain-containing protein [Bacteroidales bacterium]|nr:carboxypeptidase-like regulatory domain-containing protein [Bacteroidales bacterium]